MRTRHHVCVPPTWRKRGANEATAPIPAGVTLAEAAHRAVSEFHASRPWVPSGGDLESIGVVYVNNPPEWRPEPAIHMTWNQGVNLFGLLISIDRLAEQSGGLDGVPFYLRLAIDEPHGPTPDGSRMWFFNLP